VVRPSCHAVAGDVDEVDSRLAVAGQAAEELPEPGPRSAGESVERRDRSLDAAERRAGPDVDLPDVGDRAAIGERRARHDVADSVARDVAEEHSLVEEAVAEAVVLRCAGDPQDRRRRRRAEDSGPAGEDVDLARPHRRGGGLRVGHHEIEHAVVRDVEEGTGTGM